MPRHDFLQTGPEVSREIEDGETVAEAILGAFEGAAIDHVRRDRTLNDAVDPDALNRLFADSPSGDVRCVFDLWDRRVLLTGDEVRLYDR
jgi:hypothetical protein